MTLLWISKFIAIGLSFHISMAFDLRSEPSEILITEGEQPFPIIFNPKIFIRSMFIISNHHHKHEVLPQASKTELKDEEQEEGNNTFENVESGEFNTSSNINTKEDPIHTGSFVLDLGGAYEKGVPSRSLDGFSTSAESDEEVKDNHQLKNIEVLSLPKSTKLPYLIAPFIPEDKTWENQVRSIVNKRENEYEHIKHIESFEGSEENPEQFRLLPFEPPQNEGKEFDIEKNENLLINKNQRPFNDEFVGKSLFVKEGSLQEFDFGHPHFANRKGNHRRNFDNEELPRALTVPFAYENNVDLWRQYKNNIIQNEKVKGEDFKLSTV